MMPTPLLVSIYNASPLGEARPEEREEHDERQNPPRLGVVIALQAQERAVEKGTTDDQRDEDEAHGQTGRAVFWKRDKKRILADLDRFLRADSQHRLAHGTRPVAAELAVAVAALK